MHYAVATQNNKTTYSKLVSSIIVALTFFASLSVIAFADDEHVLTIRYNSNYGFVATANGIDFGIHDDNNIYYVDGELEKEVVQTMRDKKQDLADAADFDLRRSGYTFKGWTVVGTDERRVFNETTKYSAKQLDPDIKNGDREIILKAVWEPVTYSVVIDGNTSVSYQSNDISSLSSLELPVKTGYWFNGFLAVEADGYWKTGKLYSYEDVCDPTEPFGNVVFVTKFSPRTLYFNCVFENVESSFIDNSGTKKSSFSKTLAVHYDDSEMKFCNASEFSLYKTGYTLSGWNTKKDGSGRFFDLQKTYSAAEIKSWFDPNSNKKSGYATLYAQWEPVSIEYSVNIDGTMQDNDLYYLDKDGNLMLRQSDKKYVNSVLYTGSIDLPTAKNLGIEKQGYKLVGWKFDSGSHYYAAGSKVRVADIYNERYGVASVTYKKKTPAFSQNQPIVASAVWEFDRSTIVNVLTNAVSSVKKNIAGQIETYLDSLKKADRYQIDIINSTHFSSIDQQLKSFLTACYVCSQDKELTADKISENSLAKIDLILFESTVKEILKMSYKKDINTSGDLLTYTVSPFLYSKILKLFNIDEKQMTIVEEIANKIRSMLYPVVVFCPSTNADVSLVSGYGLQKINGKAVNNKGIDVSFDPENANVYAIRSGSVLRSTRSSIDIDYGDGFVVSYAGLSEVYKNDDDAVSFGEVFGKASESVHTELSLNGSILPPDAGKMLKSIGFCAVFGNISNDYDGVVADEYKISNNNIVWIKKEEEPQKRTDGKTTETAKSKIFSDDSYDYIEKGVVEIEGERWYSTEVYSVFDADEEFVSPLPYSDVYLSSGYGERDSIDGVTSTIHGGIDLCCDSGTEGKRVVSVCSGVVVESGWSAYGNYIVVDHGDGIQSLYGHLSSRVAETGDIVDTGELIGYAGNTYGEGGYSTGAHLHFEIRVNGEKTNPLNFVDF